MRHVQGGVMKATPLNTARNKENGTALLIGECETETKCNSHMINAHLKKAYLQAEMMEEHMEIPGIMARLWLACRVIVWIIIEEGDDQSPRTHVEPLKQIEHRLLNWNSDHMVDNSHMDMTLQRSKGLWKATIVPLRSLTRVLAFGLILFSSPITLF